MSSQFPDYPRDEDGDIPEPLCYECLRVWAEYGEAYLWDMSGVSISVSTVTGKEPEPLDDEWMTWIGWYEGKPMNEECWPMWDSPEELRSFNEKGAELARRTFEHLGERHTMVYFPIEAPVQRWDAAGKPPIRIGAR